MYSVRRPSFRIVAHEPTNTLSTFAQVVSGAVLELRENVANAFGTEAGSECLESQRKSQVCLNSRISNIQPMSVLFDSRNWKDDPRLCVVQGFERAMWIHRNL